MQRLSQIKAILDERGISPKKSLGQNFLIDHSKIEQLLKAAELAPGDLVLEIGPGTGTLTETLVELGCEVIACELDDTLSAHLRSMLGDAITLVTGDCLAGRGGLNPAIEAALGDRRFKLVANLPYQAASPLMAQLAWRERCDGQFVTIQREVGDRVRAKPGTRQSNQLAVVVQARCDARRIALLPPGCFWPAPKVTSEMLAITPRANPAPLGLRDPLMALCERLFAQRRKQIGAILKGSALLDDLPEGVVATARPESLTLEQLVAMAQRYEGADTDDSKTNGG